MSRSHGRSVLAVSALCLALVAHGQGQPGEFQGSNGQPASKSVRIVSDPMPVLPAQPVAPQPSPGPPVLKVGVGQVFKLSATGDTPENLDKMAFLWQIPTGLSYKVDSNGRDVYLAASAEGTYRVTTIASKNGTPRPEIMVYETVIQVGATSGTPPVVTGPDLSEEDKKRLQALTDKIRTATTGAQATAKAEVGRVYLTMAKFLEDKPNATLDEEVRKLNELSQPLQTVEQQKLFVQISALVEAERPNLGQIPRKHVYRALAGALGVTP